MQDKENYRIIVGLGSCGIASGGRKVYQKIKEEIKKRNIKVLLEETGCVGMCYNEVLIEVVINGSRILYKDINPDKVDRILDEHIGKGNVVNEWVAKAEGIATLDDSFFAKQERIALRNCGVISPESIEEYIDRDGYKAIEKAVSMSREEVVKEILNSGLRGRGGAGFPTGMKWRFAKEAKGEKKYFICNADEGDPGAFMDRSVIEGDPHSVIEGMLIGAYAIGADEGYIYVRAEYPLAVKRLYKAISQAEERNYLGENILGSNFSFKLHVKEGAGAFVCGEETALIASIEGKRGMPRIRPPFPAISGLWEKPTNINNVETLANIPWIINNGAEKYSKYGTEKSKGTKVFALAGKIKRGGLVEVPMGLTLREIIFDIGGGIKENRKFKAVQMGGPSGGCIPESLIDTTVDYDSITATGAIMGSGGMVVMDETTCMVDIARFFLNFTQNESCGKCTFCRVGTRRMLEILNRIVEGKGKEEDIYLLEELSSRIITTSLCGLGQTAPNPVLTTLRYFRNEYEAHIKEKKCPAHSCEALLRFEVIPELCKMCGKCAKACPENAIKWEKKQVAMIDKDKCIKCRACITSCKFMAIE
ncbi:MAG: NADH-quinone oxidoreductase subunit NuoF [bacterium]|nr:NADH-quinone oxidoreductase subunit NuoF [bacterium]